MADLRETPMMPVVLTIRPRLHMGGQALTLLLLLLTATMPTTIITIGKQDTAATTIEARPIHLKRTGRFTLKLVRSLAPAPPPGHTLCHS